MSIMTSTSRTTTTTTTTNPTTGAAAQERETELQLAGRFIGTRTRGVPRRVAVLLPEDLAAAVRAATWLESEPHITALRAWARRHPGWNGLDDSVNPDALAELREHSDQLVTTGDVRRAALARLLREETPAADA